MLEHPELPADNLVVEVTARCGEVNGVSLTTLLELRGWKENPVQARGKILAVLDLLVKALPVATVQGMDAEYHATVKDVCLNGKGEMEFASPELRQAGHEQTELKKRIKLDPPGDDEEKKGE